MALSNLCEGILVGDITGDCNAGTSPDLMEMLLINWDDIKTSSATEGVATITLKTGKKASVVQVSKKSAGGTEGLYTSDFAPNASTHSVSFVMWKRDAATTVQAEQIRRGKFVAVTKAKQLGVYEVWGMRAGLECSAGDRDTNAAGGTIKMTISTPEDSGGDTLYTIIESQYEALKVAAQ